MQAAELTSPFILLDAIQGWQIASQAGLRADASGALTLQPLPGEAMSLIDTAALAQAGMQCPSGLASDGCRIVWIVDANGGVYRIDFDRIGSETRCPTIDRIDSVGGKGSAARELSAARGIAALPDGGFAVADSGNARVQVFAGSSHALTNVWKKFATSSGEGSGTVPATLKFPWSVATDRCGNLFIVDRGNGVVRRIEVGTRTLTNIGAGQLGDPTRIAISKRGIVAVADSSNATVWLFRPGETTAFAQAKPKGQVPLSVAFGDDDTLYAGDTIGLVHAFVPDADSQGYSFVGSGDSRVTGRILDLVWAGNQGLLALIEQDIDAHPRGIWRIWPDGGFVREGSFVTRTVDSDIDDCQWHRVLLQADFLRGHGAAVADSKSAAAQPGVASIEIATYTSGDTQTTETLLAANALPWRIDALCGDPNPDCLVQNEPGRFLWLRVSLRGNGEVSPRVTNTRLYFPRQSYLEHLPAIYQDDQQSRVFLERFLSIFQTGFDNIDGAIDRLWMLFDPASTPGAYLQWLAGWVGLVIDPEWTSTQLRDRIREAYARHLVRGTPAGLEQAIGDYLDLPAGAKVLEHFRLREWATVSPGAESDGERQFWTGVAALDGTRRLWSRSFYKRLQLDDYSQIGSFRLVSRPEPALEPFDWGAHRFTVFFPADPNDEGATAKRVAAIVEREKPAHTAAELCPVYPRMRVGRQAMIGVDSRVGGVGQLTLNRLATLSYDTILGCSPYELPMRDSGTSPRPRVGTTTVLQ